MQKYKVELTGTTRYFAVAGEAGNEYTAVECYDTNSDWTERVIYNKKGEEIDDNELRNEIIEAVKNR